MKGDSKFEVRLAGGKGRGLFAKCEFEAGERVITPGGIVRSTVELRDDEMALQIGPQLWLCSNGDHLDDYINHSCEPNLGFLRADELALYALRPIATGEELTWDYSTSINESEWTLTCACGSPECRQLILPWLELPTGTRDRLRPNAMGWLRASNESIDSPLR